jgi:DNA replication protein DnaC
MIAKKQGKHESPSMATIQSAPPPKTRLETPGLGQIVEPKPLEEGWQKGFIAQARLDRARIPRRFQNKTLDNFDTKGSRPRAKLVEDARRYIQMFGKQAEFYPGLILKGEVGCGKTHLAVAILRAIVDKGHGGLYYNMPDLLMDIRATYDANASLSESELLEELEGPELLVLDDLGAEKTADWVNDRLYLIVNRRYEECRPIIVTTNLGLDELTEKLGNRIVSRLCETADLWDKFPKEDYRRKHMT